MTIKKWGVLFGVLLANLLILTVTFAQAELPPNEGGGMQTGIPEGSTLIGDMVFPAGLDTRGTYSTNSWAGGIVPYSFAADVTTDNQNRAIAAMVEWETVAGLDFVPRTSEIYYINFINSTGNWSYVGRQGGKQDIGLYNWNYKYIIAHEVGHALGLWHEQSRPDRDTYVTIHLENIQSGQAHNFNMVGLAHGEYDFDSVMHYGADFFSSNGQPTITANPGYQSSQALMGNRTHLSNGDKAVMAFLYPSGETPATARTITSYGYAVNFNSAPYTEGGEPFPTDCLAGANLTDTLWFKIPANSTDRITTLTAGGYDTLMAIYRGTPEKLTLEACANQSVGGELVDFPLLTNADYYIQVGGVNGSAGMLAFAAAFKNTLTFNGGFEDGSTAWVVKSVPSIRADDAVKTGANGVINSAGWAQFKGGAGENSTITQTRTFTGRFFNVGDIYRFGGDVLAPSVKNSVILKLNVKYSDGTRTQAKITQTGAFSTWTTATAPITIARTDVTSVVMVVNNKSSGGKTYVDNLTLVFESYGGGGGGGQGDALPLPATQSNFRGNN